MDSFFKKEIRLGIIKGGQLGRMLIQPCIDLGVIPCFMDTSSDAPVRNYCKEFTLGDEKNFEDVYTFGKTVDTLTLEFENVNIEALQALESEGISVCPSSEIIKIVQDKGEQKRFYKRHGFPTAPYAVIESKSELAALVGANGVVQKLRRDGYDGRGVVVIDSPDEIASKGFDAPSIVEEKVAVEKEISVMVARNKMGEIKTFPTVEMVFHPTANMLDYLFSPALLTPEQNNQAIAIAEKLAQKIELIGILAIEMFITKSGEVLINEIAPRPHNSGHHTIEASATSQYQQHLRAIFNLPLGDTSRYLPAAMVNIVGAPEHVGEVYFDGIRPFLHLPGVYFHRYGKKITKPYRKMGHVTIVRQNVHEAIELAKQITEKVKAKTCQ